MDRGCPPAPPDTITEPFWVDPIPRPLPNFAAVFVLIIAFIRFELLNQKLSLLLPIVPPTTPLEGAGWAGSPDNVRLFLPSLRVEDEAIAFQNLPQYRSVPQMAHAHVFLRARTDATANAIAALQAERRIRSPWAEAERLGGRGDEVGFYC